MYGFNSDCGTEKEYVCYAIVFGEFVAIRSSTFFNGNYIFLSSSMYGNSLSPVYVPNPKDIERDEYAIPITTYIDCKIHFVVVSLESILLRAKKKILIE